jgi:hypothetical protein
VNKNTQHLPFRAYDGNEPFIFVSYSHQDSDSVFPFLTWLHESGVNIWYDEGISLGQSWPEELAQAIERADEFVWLVTKHSVDSPNCQREINFSLSHGKTFLAIHLEEVELPAGIELSISDRQAIMRTHMPEDEFNEKLLEHLAPYSGGGDRIQSPQPKPPVIQKRSGLSMALVLAVVMVVAVPALLWFLDSNKEAGPPVTIDDPILEIADPVAEVEALKTLITGLKLNPLIPAGEFPARGFASITQKYSIARQLIVSYTYTIGLLIKNLGAL